MFLSIPILMELRKRFNRFPARGFMYGSPRWPQPVSAFIGRL
ncbi:hypothetical protein QEZ54_33825 [Catellatospora sp. KI3]|nr:hypothetical protein [Catellatospora sp. KI3]MDI1465966.1 hypothetical protein [Catellatospora sp. KI3]